MRSEREDGGHRRGCRGPGPERRGQRGDFGDERGGRRRLVDKGQLRLAILRLLAEEPRHGYDLIRAIEERTGGAYAPSPGAIYPTLTLLTDMGFAAEKAADGARKLYEITEQGRAHLAANADEVATIFARFAAIGEVRDRLDAGPLRRAVHNLRAVLQDRFAQEQDREKLHEAVALIDDVARRIERL